MAKLSDVRIEAVALSFHAEKLAVPLHLSRGVITDVTYAKVVVTVRTRAGQPSQGVGAILLSDLWAFPHPVYTHEQKDEAMPALCSALAASMQTGDDYGDPLEKGHHLDQTLPSLIRNVEQALPFLATGAIPYLAAQLSSSLRCGAP